jgi:hypothetical protein
LGVRSNRQNPINQNRIPTMSWASRAGALAKADRLPIRIPPQRKHFRKKTVLSNLADAHAPVQFQNDSRQSVQPSEHFLARGGADKIQPLDF